MSYEEADTCFNVGENKTLNFDPRNNPLFCLCFVLFVGKRFVLFVGKGFFKQGKLFLWGNVFFFFEKKKPPQ
jgi:hypothetical protein